MSNGLEGKSIIVTGGSSGIGAAGVLQLIEAGCDVTIADLNEESGEELVSRISAGGKGRAQFVRTDIGQEADVERMVATAIGTFGKLNGAINAAGMQPSATNIDELSIEEWDRRVNITLRGTFLCLKHEIAALKKNSDGGAVVAISSTAAVTPVPASSEYCAAKAGVNSLCRAAALEMGIHNISVNSVMPGATDTPMMRSSGADNPLFAAIVQRTPFGRIGQPGEVSALAVWLMSDQARWVTGQSISADGGITLS